MIECINYRELRQSIAGQLVLNLSFGLLGWECSLLFPSTISFLLQFYFTLVFAFASAAEGVLMFQKIVLVFSKFDHYPLKTALVSWSKLYDKVK